MRLNDNPALDSALENCQSLLPLFILDPVLIQKYAPRRQSFLWEGLHRLDDDLRKRGSRLVVRRGDPPEALQKLVQEIEVHGIFAEEDYSPYARSRDARVARLLPLEIVQGATVHHPESLKKSDGGVYKVFTPFSRLWRELPLPGKPGTVIPESFPTVPPVESLPIPQFLTSRDFPAGELGSAKATENFLVRKDIPI